MDQHVPPSPPDCLSDVLHVADALRFLHFGGWVREDRDAGEPYWAGLRTCLQQRSEKHRSRASACAGSD